jgi:predicted RNA polymerase sigma factor
MVTLNRIVTVALVLGARVALDELRAAEGDPGRASSRTAPARS